LLIGNLGLNAAQCPPLEDVQISYVENEAVYMVEAQAQNMRVDIEHPTLGFDSFYGGSTVIVPEEWWTPPAGETVYMSVYRVCPPTEGNQIGTISAPSNFQRTGATNALIGDINIGGTGGTLLIHNLCNNPTATTVYYNVVLGTDPLLDESWPTDCFCNYLLHGLYYFDNVTNADDFQNYYGQNFLVDGDIDGAQNDYYIDEIAVDADLSQVFIGTTTVAYDRPEVYFLDPAVYADPQPSSYFERECEEEPRPRQKHEGLDANNYLLAPNPTYGIVNVSLSNDVASEYSIYSINGSRVSTVRIPNLSTFEIDLSDLDAGFYFVSYRLTTGEVKTSKIVKK